MRSASICWSVTKVGSEWTSSSCSTVTSTYFEGKAQGNAKAKRGYSRDKRSDCKQVNIGLVVTPEGGLPMGYEVLKATAPT